MHKFKLLLITYAILFDPYNKTQEVSKSNFRAVLKLREKKEFDKGHITCEWEEVGLKRNLTPTQYSLLTDFFLFRFVALWAEIELQKISQSLFFFFSLLVFKIFIGVQLLYNVVLGSTVQQSESAICIHISPLFFFFNFLVFVSWALRFKKKHFPGNQ